MTKYDKLVVARLVSGCAPQSSSCQEIDDDDDESMMNNCILEQIFELFLIDL